MRSFIVGVAFLGSLAACDSSTGNGNSSLLTLEAYRTQWESRDFHAYSFDLSETYFGHAYNLHLTVQSDTVASVVDIDTGLPPEFSPQTPTIDDLFADADAALRQSGSRVSLEFDSHYGNVSSFSAYNNTPAGGYSATVTNLQPTE